MIPIITIRRINNKIIKLNEHIDLLLNGLYFQNYFIKMMNNNKEETLYINEIN